MDAGLSSSSRERRRRRDGNNVRARTTAPSSRRRCAIRPREGQNMSCLLVFLLAIAQAVAFCGKDGSATARIIDERWQRSLPWVLRTDVFVPVTVSFFGCIAFQHQYLVPLCSHASYIIIGHNGVISPAWASALLSCGTVLAYTYVWFLRCKKAVGKELLLGEYHEDFFQLLLALSASCNGFSCSPGYWKFLSVHVLLTKTESLTLWMLTR
jgi:hypothetical protein